MIFLNENSLKIFNPKNLFPCFFGHQSGGLNQDYNPVDNIQWHVVCYLKKNKIRGRQYVVYPLTKKKINGSSARLCLGPSAWIVL
jgi:hypothetical protein